MDRKRQKLTLEKVIAELEQVKEELARSELESEIDKYKEQCTELQRENEKLQSEKEKLQSKNEKLESENEKLQCENEKLQSENKRLQKYLQDLESANVNVEEKSQINLYNTDLNSQITKVNESNVDALDINSFPSEIILNVFGYLEQNQLGQIARVCRRWNVLTKSAVLWRKVNVKIFSSDREKNAVAKSFINGLPSCVTFIRLDFSECEDRIHVDFEKLCVKLQQNCPHLEELILTHLKISNIIPEVIQLCTQFLQDVKKLVFHRCSFSDYSATVEFDGTSKIEVLDLSYCDFGHFNKPQFEGLLYLKKLRLNSTNVDDTWFRDYTSFCNQLHVLDLGWTPITASTIVAIQNYGLNLKELYLCWVYLRDSDLNFNYSVFSHLQTICLSCTGVTCEDVVSFIQSCSSLKNVYVDECVAESFAAHPFVVANRCKSVIVKAIDWDHDHDVDYSHN